MDKNISQLAKGSATNFVGKFFAYLCQYVSLYFLVRTLGDNNYGIYVLVVTLFEFCSQLGQFGLPRGVERYIAIYHQQNNTEKIWGIVWSSVATTILLSGLLSLLLFLFSDLISISWFKSPEINKLLKQLWWLVPINALFLLTHSFFVGLSHMRYRTYLADLFLPTSWAIIVIVFFFWRPGILSYFWAKALLFFLSTVLAFLLLKNLVPYVKVTWKRTKSTAKRLIFFSLPLVFSTIISRLLIRIDIFMLGYFLQPSHIAVYHIARRLGEIQNTFLDPINRVISPHTAKLSEKQDYSLLSKDYQMTCRWLIQTSLPISLVFFLFGEHFLTLFDPSFSSGKWVLICLVSANLFKISTGSSGVIISMAGYPKINLMNTAIVGILNIILNLIFIPKYGILGAAIATSFSIVCINFLKLFETYYLWSLFPYTKYTIKLITIALISYGAGSLFKQAFPIVSLLHLITGCALILSFYSACLLLSGLHQDEKEILRKGKRFVLNYLSRY